MDALGEEFVAQLDPRRSCQQWTSMKPRSGCEAKQDPVPINIVDLGLIYDLQISGDEGAQLVEVKTTLTARLRNGP